MNIIKSSKGLRDIIVNLAKQNEQLEEMINQLSRKVDIVATEMVELKNQVDNVCEKKYLSTEYLALNMHQTKKKKVLISGYYGAQNYGDELMLQMALQYIDANKFEITILLSENYMLDSSYYAPFKVIHYPKGVEDCQFLADYFDAIIWCGGAVLDDLYYEYRDKHTNLAYIAMSISKQMIKQGKKVFVLGVGTNDELKNVDFIKDLNYIINNASLFLLRDSNSLKTMEMAKIDTSKIGIIDDLALGHDYGSGRTSPDYYTVGVILLIDDENIEYLTRFMFYLDSIFDSQLTGKPVRYHFIPFFNLYNHDVKYFQRIRESIGKETIEITDIQPDANDIGRALSACDLVVSMRYHATLIAGAVLGRSVLCIDYGDTHQHYHNKIKYIKDNYCKNLVSIDYKKICREDELKVAIKKAVKIKNEALTVRDKKRIKSDIEKIFSRINREL